MTRNSVMNLWTAIVTAVLTLFTSLGLITTTAVAAAAAAVPEVRKARNTTAPQEVKALEEAIRPQPYAHSLPPTMKQRIHAEAHGSSPSCRHRPPTDASTPDVTAAVPHDSTPSTPASPNTPVTPVTPTGITRTTTGVTDVGTPEGGPTAELAAELPTRTPTVTCASTAPAAPAAVTLPSQPSQSSRPTAPTAPRLPAPATAPVLAPAGTATRG
ncbi:DUF6344 domain-containing protein [Streptomyces sp. CWNU-52B]|uniref:DUF6344 domain-containing protein n=1 Tax=unclassified Streptomyces TaxID=2593676 RepID=UPI0039C3C076